MSMWIDVKYASFLARQLDKWQQLNTQPFLAKFRCPICGDSQKNKSKTRGFLFVNKNGLSFKCHNCSESHSFYYFLRLVSPGLADEYNAEKYFEQNQDKPPTPPEHKKKSAAEKPVFSKKNALEETFMFVAELPKRHPAKQYLDSRKIPLKGQHRLVYIDDIDRLGESLGIYMKKKIRNRIGIPFHRLDGKLNGLTCRALDDDTFRYMTMKFDDEPKFFGAHLVKKKQDIFVTEGAFDSLFLDNAMAVGDSGLTRVQSIFNTDQCILVYDNQPRNKEIVKLMLDAWYKDFRVVVWPDTVVEKDINEMVLAGRDVKSIVRDNIFAGPELRLKIGEWRRVVT